MMASLSIFAVAAMLVGAQAAPDVSRDDEKTLKTTGLGVDGDSLLGYFRERTVAEADPKELQRLRANLASDDFDTREDAFLSLAKLGTAALTALKQSENDSNPEVRRRVAELKRRIEAKAEAAVQSAAIRSIARARPAGAAEVLLGYAPFASDPSVVDEIGRAVGMLCSGAQVDAAVVRALQSDKPVQRGLAGEALARGRAQAHLPAARRLLKDPEPIVRLRVALALASIKEQAAVPALVELLGELNADQLWQAEEVLVRLAGDRAPDVALGSDAASRKVARAAWQDWLAKQTKLDLDRLTEAEPLQGLTVLVQQHNVRPGIGLPGKARVGGEVFELDQNKKITWTFPADTYPVDVAIVGNDRVIVAEYQAARISERNFKGDVLWKKEINGNPISVQRLPSGNIFVVMQNRLLEVNRQGDEVFSYPRLQQHDIMRGRKLRNGDVIYITSAGVLTRMNAKAEPIKVYNVGPVQVLFGNIDVLPNGHLLLPEFHGNRVVEYDADGKQVAQINVTAPNSAVRLPNGHTLVASQNTRRVIEFDRTGGEVWSYQCEGSVFNAYRR